MIQSWMCKYRHTFGIEYYADSVAGTQITSGNEARGIITDITVKCLFFAAHISMFHKIICKMCSCYYGISIIIIHVIKGYINSMHPELPTHQVVALIPCSAELFKLRVESFIFIINKKSHYMDFLKVFVAAGKFYSGNKLDICTG